MPSERPRKILRASDVEVQAWEDAAARAGLTFNAWAAQVLGAAAEGVAPLLAATPAAPVKPGGASRPAPSASGKRSYKPDFKSPPPEKKHRFR